MKKALATLDCVVVGVEVGHGKRHGVLSDYTFAVRDDATGALVTIGKAYSGLTDAEIAEMTAWFEAHTIARHGRYRVVEPSVVVEVAFDVIMRSGRHQSGFALRFPRIARLRPDKTAAECDTLATVEVLWRELQHGAEHLVTRGARPASPADRWRLPSRRDRPAGRPAPELTGCHRGGAFSVDCEHGIRRPPIRTVPMTLYTEQFVVRGTIQTRQHRVTDILNEADQPFLVLEDVSLEEFGFSDVPDARRRSPRSNLASILFAVSLQAVEPARGAPHAEGRRHARSSRSPRSGSSERSTCCPERSLRDSLAELHGPRSSR